MNPNDLSKEELLEVIRYQQQKLAERSHDNVAMIPCVESKALSYAPQAQTAIASTQLSETVFREQLHTVNPLAPSLHETRESRELLQSGGIRKTITRSWATLADGCQYVPGQTQTITCRSCGRVFAKEGGFLRQCNMCSSWVCGDCVGEVEGPSRVIRQVTQQGVIETVQPQVQVLCAKCYDKVKPRGFFSLLFGG